MALACDRLHDLSKTLVTVLEAVENFQDVAVYPSFWCNSSEPVWCHSICLRHEMSSGRISLVATFITVGILQTLANWSGAAVPPWVGCRVGPMTLGTSRHLALDTRHNTLRRAVAQTEILLVAYLVCHNKQTSFFKPPQMKLGTWRAWQQHKHFNVTQPSLAKLAFIDLPEADLPRLPSWSQTLVFARWLIW